MSAFNTDQSDDQKAYLMSRVAIAPLGEAHYEAWVADEDVTYRRTGDIEVARTSDLAMVRVQVAEPATAHTAMSTLAEASFEAYRSLFEVVRDQNLGGFARVWNYVPEILKAQSGDLRPRDRERYRQFNIGRHDAWQKLGPTDERGNPLYPSATGIGAIGGPLVVECLLSQRPISHLENPRQTPAYEYPRRYGLRSPSFARATLHRGPKATEIFIAGTSSIVGDETTHAGDLRGQLAETLLNLQALIGSDNLAPYNIPGQTLADLRGVRVYVKDPKDQPIMDRVLRASMGEAADIVYLRDDICRPDLSLEIEGVVQV